MIDAGRFRLDGGAMFGVVPRALWSRVMPPDDRNRIHMCTNLLLVRDDEHTILIDTGMGTSNDVKFNDIYAVDLSEYNLADALAAQGVKPKDITDVILTHLHFDHAGGATKPNKKGVFQPTFPNAKYYVQSRQFGWAMQPTPKDRASFVKSNFIPLQENNQLILVDGEQELFPGIEVLPVDGHTEGQQVVLIHGEGETQTMLYAADLVPTAAHVPTPWIMAYDLQPLATIKEKEYFLDRAADRNWLVFIEHDPETHCLTVEKTEKGFRIKERIDLR